VSSITQAKAEAQKLIRRYNQLQAEAKTAESTAEAARKAAEANKLVSQISVLQLAITKLQAKDREAAAKKKPATANNKKLTTSATKSPIDEIKRTASSKMALEERMGRLEEAQKKTRAQIEQLTRAKTELTRLKHEAQKSAASVVKERRAHDEKLQQELAKLIAKKEAEHQALKQELEAIRQQAQKDAELLKVQRDAARAMMEKHKQLEKDKSLTSYQNRSNKGWLIGVIIVAIFALILGGLLAILFTPKNNTTVPPKPDVESTNKNDKNTVKPPHSPPPLPPKPPITTYRDQLKYGQGPEMVKLPGGTFKMGNKNTLLYHDERPQHEVTLESFSISKYEVTFEEYDLFVWATDRKRPDDGGWGRGQRPVINVSWHDAMAYTEWLSVQTSHRYRLPSEREWEYAAAAGSENTYWWGYKLEKNKANCGICGSKWDAIKTAPVGRFKPNSFKIYDTIGNVMEWTLSCYRSSYRGAPAKGNKWEWKGRNCSRRVARSSSFKSYQNDLRTTRRHKYSPNTRMDTLGFRVVRID
jgi:formylglycine-generating enzyme required for sulfatase activity